MAVLLPKLTVNEYLAIEREAEYKSEYCGGEMFAMSGGSRAHSGLSLHLASLLLNRLEKGIGSEVHGSDMKVQTGLDGLYTYPDLTVACGKPTLIFGVLSNSAEANDRGFKFQQYKLIPSLEEYVLVAQSDLLIEPYGRRRGRIIRKHVGSTQYRSLTVGRGSAPRPASGRSSVAARGWKPRADQRSAPLTLSEQHWGSTGSLRSSRWASKSPLAEIYRDIVFKSD